MKKVLGEYSVFTTQKKEYDLIEILSKEKLVFSLKVIARHTESVLNTIEKHQHLISGPKSINLFEKEQLTDHIRKIWLYYESLVVSSIDLEKYMLSALDEPNAIDTLVEYGMADMQEASDEEILSCIRRNLYYDEDGMDLTIEGSTALDSPYITKMDYASIIKKIRDIFEIKEIEPIDLDDFIGLSGEQYILEHLARGLNVDLKEIAYRSKNAKEFKKKVLALTKTNPGHRSIGGVGGGTGFGLDGFKSFYQNGLKRPKMEISYLGICLLHNNVLSGDTEWSKDILTLEGQNFWDEVWQELARIQEKTLYLESQTALIGAKEELGKLEQYYTALKSSNSAKLGDDFEMTLKNIAQEVEHKFGIKRTDAAIGAAIKKALGQIKLKLEQKGLSYEDLSCA